MRENLNASATNDDWLTDKSKRFHIIAEFGNCTQIWRPVISSNAGHWKSIKIFIYYLYTLFSLITFFINEKFSQYFYMVNIQANWN